MTSRRFAALAAFAAAILTATAALAIPPGQVAPVLSGVAKFPTPAVQPQPSAFAGYDNSWFFGNTSLNNGATFPASAMNVPATVTNSWNIIFKFRYEDAAWARAQTKSLGIMGSCSITSCGGGSDKFLSVASPTSGTPNELLMSAKTSSSANLWNSPISSQRTGIILKENTDYCVVISQYGTDSASSGDFSIAAVDAAGTIQQSVSTTANNTVNGNNIYYTSSALRTRAAIGNIFANWATLNTTATWNVGSAGPFGAVGMFYGVMPNTAGAPDAATLKSLCAPANDLKAAALAAGFTIQSLYNPNASGGYTADAAGAITTALTTIGSGFVASSPIMSPACLQLTEQGPYDVFRVEPGMWGGGATGTIYVNGAWSTTGCGGKVSALEMRVLSAGSPIGAGWKTVLKNPAATFAASYSGVPAGGPYTFEVRPKNSPALVYKALNPVYVGMVLQSIGQSQVCVLGFANVAAGTGVSLAFSGATMSTGGVDTSSPPRPYIRQVTALTQPGSSTGGDQIGDGVLQLMQDLAASSGWPVSYETFCKSGQAAEAWAYDYLPATKTLTASGGNTSFGGGGTGNQLTDPTFVGGAGTPQTYASGNGFHSMLKGSLKIVNGSGLQIGHDDGAGSVVGDNGATVSSSTVTYIQNVGSAAVTVTFSGAQTTPVVANWTNLEDTQGGTYTPNTSYTGYGTFGDGVNAASGLVATRASRASGPPSMLIETQCTTNAGEVGSVFGAATAGYASLTAKWDQINGRLAAMSFWKPGTPVLVLDYSRDGNDGVSSVAGCRQFFQHYAGLDGTSRPSTVYWGGAYYDNAIQITASVGQPHEDSSVFGGRRMGQRIAVSAALTQRGVRITDPTITGCAFKTPGPDYTKIVCTVNLPQGTSIATCGSNLSGGTSPFATGVCTFTTANGTVVKGVRIGCCNATAASATYAAYDGLQEAAAPAIFTQSPNPGFSCTITSATTFECDKTATGTPWVTGQTFVQYMVTAPFARVGGVVNYTIAAGGSGYTANATVTLTASSGGCSGTFPQVQVKTNGSGVITSALPLTLGTKCTSNPTVTISGLGAGTGGSITAAFVTAANDNDDMAASLYDNSGGFGASGAAGGSAPGWPVRPVIVPIAVTG